MLVRRPPRPPRGIPPCDTLRPILLDASTPPLLRSRARRNRSDVLGRRVASGFCDGCETDVVSVFLLSHMSDVDERRIFGGDEMVKNDDGVVACDREL